MSASDGASGEPGPPSPESSDEVTDQRVLRGLRNRDAIVDAVMELIEEGNLSPTADQVAARAGVSRRSVYHHFDDLEDLTRAVSDRHLARYVELMEPTPTEGTLDERRAAFVRQRSTLAERLMPVYRASRLLAHTSPTMAEQLAATHEILRDELRRTFEPELAGAPSWTIEALDALTSLDGWARLRVKQRLSVVQARRVVDQALRAILSPRS
jgi:AcrR family transcriptional regulator